MADTDKTIGHRAWNMAQGTDQQWEAMNQHQRQAFERVAAAAAAITRYQCSRIASEISARAEAASLDCAGKDRAYEQGQTEAADEIESRILKLK